MSVSDLYLGVGVVESKSHLKGNYQVCFSLFVLSEAHLCCAI